METSQATKRGCWTKCLTLRRAVILAFGYTFFCLVWISIYSNGPGYKDNYVSHDLSEEQDHRISHRARFSVRATSNVSEASRNKSSIFKLFEKPFLFKNFIKQNEPKKAVIPSSIKSLQGEVKMTTLQPNSSSLPFVNYRRINTNEAVSFHCKTCALVSSSGQLLNKNAGSEIDAHDCVIRMNDAPTQGFEKDVGKRTTIRVIGHSNIPRSIGKDEEVKEKILGDHDQFTERMVIHFFYHTDIEGLSEFQLINELAQNYPKTKFDYFTSDKMKFSEKLFLQETGITRTQAHTWFSTGWFAMLYAIDTCESIHVYGMVYENYCREHPKVKVPYHYYDPTFKTECDYYKNSEVKLSSGHLFITEKALFGRWSSQYKIIFHYPKWRAKDFAASHTLYTPFLQRYKIANDRLLAKHPWWRLFFHFAGLFYPLVH